MHTYVSIYIYINTYIYIYTYTVIHNPYVQIRIHVHTVCVYMRIYSGGDEKREMGIERKIDQAEGRGREEGRLRGKDRDRERKHRKRRQFAPHITPALA